MKKTNVIRIISLILIVLCLASIFASCSKTKKFTQVERTVTSVEDRADLLSDAEETELRAYLDAIAKNHTFEVAVCTVASTGGKTGEEFADDEYDYKGYGYGENYDGILLVVFMSDDQGERGYHMSTFAKGEKVFSDRAFDYTEEQFLDSLKAENYYEAFKKFGGACDYVISYYEANGKAMAYPFAWYLWLGIGLLVGIIIALIVTGSMKSKLTSVKMQAAAQSYIRPNSLQLTQSRDYFVYRTVTRTARPKNTGSSGGSHTSSSGRSHGGRGGSF